MIYIETTKEEKPAKESAHDTYKRGWRWGIFILFAIPMTTNVIYAGLGIKEVLIIRIAIVSWIGFLFAWLILMALFSPDAGKGIEGGKSNNNATSDPRRYSSLFEYSGESGPRI